MGMKTALFQVICSWRRQPSFDLWPNAAAPLRQRTWSVPAQEEDPVGCTEAITATAYKLARTIYSILKYDQKYADAGADYYEQQYRKRALNYAKRRAAQLGYNLAHLADSQ